MCIRDSYTLLGTLAEELGVDLTEDWTIDSSLADLHEAVSSLEIDGVSDVISSGGSLFLAVRRPLDTRAVAQDYFSHHLQDLCSDAQVSFHKLYDTIDTGSFYTALVECRYDLAEEFAVSE